MWGFWGEGLKRITKSIRSSQEVKETRSKDYLEIQQRDLKVVLMDDSKHQKGLRSKRKKRWELNYGVDIYLELRWEFRADEDPQICHSGNEYFHRTAIILLHKILGSYCGSSINHVVSSLHIFTNTRTKFSINVNFKVGQLKNCCMLAGASSLPDLLICLHTPIICSNTQRISQARVFAHLIPTWWHCFEETVEPSRLCPQQKKCVMGVGFESEVHFRFQFVLSVPWPAKRQVIFADVLEANPEGTEKSQQSLSRPPCSLCPDLRRTRSQISLLPLSGSSRVFYKR